VLQFQIKWYSSSECLGDGLHCVGEIINKCYLDHTLRQFSTPVQNLAFLLNNFLGALTVPRSQTVIIPDSPNEKFTNQSLIKEYSLSYVGATTWHIDDFYSGGLLVYGYNTLLFCCLCNNDNYGTKFKINEKIISSTPWKIYIARWNVLHAGPIYKKENVEATNTRTLLRFAAHTNLWGNKHLYTRQTFRPDKQVL
jgi:hypothetical protein